MNAQEPLVVDCHNDLLLELAFRRAEPNPFATHWLDKLAAGRIRLQVCPVYAGLERLPEGALRGALEQVVACHRAIGENRDRARLVQTKEDLAKLSVSHVGLMLSMEGAEPFGYDPEMINVFWALGVRMFALTYNRRNPFADGLAEPEDGGLSALGRKLLDRLTSLGGIIDLAHASDRTFWSVLERAPDAAFVISHAGCRAVFDSRRNATDDQLRALAAAGGVLGIMADPLAVDPYKPTLARVIEHIDHAVSIMGSGCVGLGADFIQQVLRSGAAQMPPDSLWPEELPMDVCVEELSSPEHYPVLIDALRLHGYRGAELEGLLGGNFLRLFTSALPER